MMFKEQRLDHFSPLVSTTWEQRYLENTKYLPTTLEGKHPLFVLFGGLEPLPQDALDGLYIITEQARVTEGAVLAIEHRFFGGSLPSGDVSKGALKRLNSMQAVADAVTLVEWWIREHGLPRSNIEIIAVGSGYGGLLAGYARQHYPHVFSGAIAHSAPRLLRITVPERRVDLVTVLSQRGDELCGERYQRALVALKDIIETGHSSVIESLTADQVRTLFHIDKLPESGSLDADEMFSGLQLIDDAMFSALPVEDGESEVQRLCAALAAADEATTDHNYVTVLADFYQHHFGASLSTDFDAHVHRLSFDEAEGVDAATLRERMELWEQCTETGSFPVRNSDVAQGAGPSFAYFATRCSRVFGLPENALTPLSLHYSAMLYGSDSLVQTNVLLLYGTADASYSQRARACDDAVDCHVEVKSYAGLGDGQTLLWHTPAGAEVADAAVRQAHADQLEFIRRLLQ